MSVIKFFVQKLVPVQGTLFGHCTRQCSRVAAFMILDSFYFWYSFEVSK